MVKKIFGWWRNYKTWTEKVLKKWDVWDIMLAKIAWILFGMVLGILLIPVIHFDISWLIVLIILTGLRPFYKAHLMK